MVIIDAHLDLSWNALGWNRDLDQTVAAIRLSEAGMQDKGRATNTVAFPDMRRGRIGIALATVLARCNPRGSSSIDFAPRRLRLPRPRANLHITGYLSDAVPVASWSIGPPLNVAFRSGKPIADAPFGFILSMEGADPIVSPAHAVDWYQAGLRVVGLARYGPSAYAHGTGSPGGLTQAGRELLRVMEELNLILDMTHLADESFWQAADHFKGPVLASHNTAAPSFRGAGSSMMRRSA